MGSVAQLDPSSYYNISDVVAAVAKNLKQINPDERTQVLLAVAVLYGIIKPGEPQAPPPPAPYRTRMRGDSLRKRVLERLQRAWTDASVANDATPTELAAELGAKVETIAATLSKLVSSGEIERTERGHYRALQRQGDPERASEEK